MLFVRVHRTAPRVAWVLYRGKEVYQEKPLAHARSQHTQQLGYVGGWVLG